ncbi:GNAT family N-acetyltransferase [Gorillibacterium massiliense]|uniref:GNAT family N-acetyltransferase n=1 Tax=Gorillibacterium massiliense TaxID=1280390 RepID=UPI0004BC593D|nr:GNAT family N-acetyltransferase [Gorillibacterium massiliense]
MKLVFIEKGLEALDAVEPLWYGLRDHHAQHSLHFSGAIARQQFQQRTSEIKAKADLGSVHICLALDEEKGHPVGYCISSIDEFNKGEIDSIYILDGYRGCGIGDKLMTNALDWLRDHQVNDIGISVMYGNEAVFSFYQKYGFYPRTYQLQNVK